LNGLFCIDDTKDSDATNTHGQQSKDDEQSKQEPTDLQKAYDEISNATTVDQLKAIHKKYSNLNNNKNFMAALTAKKSAINSGL
jgi:tRNA(Met) C34 N-acetyltransferase TmcA